MIQDIQKHKLAYSLLSLFAMLFLALAYLYRNSPPLLLVITAGFGFLYFFWGVLHHLSERNLNLKLVLEYGLVTVLGLIIMSTLLL